MTTKSKQNTPAENLREALVALISSEIFRLERSRIYQPENQRYVGLIKVDKKEKRYHERLKVLLDNIKRFEM